MTFDTEKAKTNKTRFECYCPLEDKPIIDKAKKHFKAEGSSLSKFVTETIKHYMATHGEGNPQQRILRYTNGKGPFVAKGSCGFRFCKRPATSTATFLPEDREYRVCAIHLREIRNNPSWKHTERELGK